MNFRFYGLPLSAMILLLSGCAWFHDNRPAPEGSPYDAAAKPPKEQLSYTEAEAVNAAVSAISLRMATSTQGPFLVVPDKMEITPLGYQVIDALTRMRLSRYSSPHTLRLQDGRTNRSQWNFTLRMPDGTILITKTFQLKESLHAGP